MSRKIRQTIATSPASPAPFRILLYTLPLCCASVILIVAMPFTAILSLLVLSLCLFILPFKAKRGLCPNCGKAKTFPFSGFGNACRGCGEDLVLRGKEIHQIEK